MSLRALTKYKMKQKLYRSPNFTHIQQVFVKYFLAQSRNDTQRRPQQQQLVQILEIVSDRHRRRTKTFLTATTVSATECVSV